jgi:hypothetical protein
VGTGLRQEARDLATRGADPAQSCRRLDIGRVPHLSRLRRALRWIPGLLADVRSSPRMTEREQLTIFQPPRQVCTSGAGRWSGRPLHALMAG